MNAIYNRVLATCFAIVAATVATEKTAVAHEHATHLPQYADPAEPALPQTDMVVTAGDTALVITDPQIDFLSPEGVTWGVVGESVTELGTVEKCQSFFRAQAERFKAGCSHGFFP